MFGPSMPDTEAPTVSITSPMDGDEFDPGASFEIQVTANDDTGIQQLLLFNNGSQVDSDTSAP